MDWNVIAGVALTLATVVAGVYVISVKPKRAARRRRERPD